MRRAHPWSAHRTRGSEPRTSRRWLARPPEQRCRNRADRVGSSRPDNFSGLLGGSLGIGSGPHNNTSWGYGAAIVRSSNWPSVFGYVSRDLSAVTSGVGAMFTMHPLGLRGSQVGSRGDAVRGSRRERRVHRVGTVVFAVGASALPHSSEFREQVSSCPRYTQPHQSQTRGSDPIRPWAPLYLCAVVFPARCSR